MKTYLEILNSKRTFKKSFIIYALIKSNKIVYIGQSKNIIARITDHLRSNKIFDSWNIVENLGECCTQGELDRLENKYIRKFTPLYNKTSNPLYKRKYQSPHHIKVKRKYSQLGIVLKGKTADDYRG
jgi:excinuclease UvrABC nuclease subunit